MTKRIRITKAQKKEFIDFINRPDIIEELKNIRKPKRNQYIAKRFEEETGRKVSTYLIYYWNKIPLEPSIYIDPSKVRAKSKSDSDIETNETNDYNDS